MNRTIIFGDIHGCYEEWKDLLSRLRVTDQDRVISVGDMIGKGPSSRKVLDLAMNMKNFQVVLGNLELYLLRQWKKGKLNDVKDRDIRNVLQEMGNDLEGYLQFIKKWPYYLEFPEFLVVHAGIRPNIPLEKQKSDDLVLLRTIRPGNRPWYEFYKDPKLIVHGHWARQGLVVRDNVIGLDTGCVYGKKLTAVILPEREIVSVPARKPYVLPVL